MKIDLKNKGKYIVDQFRHFSKVTGYPVKVDFGMDEKAEKEKEQNSEIIENLIDEYGGASVCTSISISVEIDGIGRWEMQRKKHAKRLDGLCDKLERKFQDFYILVENTAERYDAETEEVGKKKVEEKVAEPLTPEQQAFHDATTHNRESIERSKMCGCYYCEYIFPASEITDDNYIDNGTTACCPNCDMDTVYGDASGIELTPEHLKKLHRRWFGDD